MNYPLTIKEITSQKIVLKDDDDNLIYLPKNKLPENLAIGQTIKLQINLNNTDQKNDLAKEILNELLEK